MIIKSGINTIAAVLLLVFCSHPQAALLSTTGDGELANVGDAINGIMTFDTGTADYSLELTAATNLVGSIEWNGPGRSEPNGLSWNDRSNSWTVALTLSQPVNLVFGQIGQAGLANEPQSVWTILWDTPGATSILDPDNQLDDPVTSAGAGTTTHSSLSRLFNSDATWQILGPDTLSYIITWENPTGAGPGTDAFGIEAGLSSLPSSSAIPLPAAIWLFGTALIGLVGFSKRKYSR